MPAARHTRAITLPNNSPAWEFMWETPSDPRARPAAGVRSWAVLRIEHDPNRRQFVPSVHRLYTRPEGTPREVMTTRVVLHQLARPASSADDLIARNELRMAMDHLIPGLVGADKIVAGIFPVEDFQ